MRILFLATNVPVAPYNGQAIRSLSILKSLASRGHRINFLAFSSKAKIGTADLIFAYCENIDIVERAVTNLSNQSDYVQRFRALMSFKSYSIERFRSKLMSGWIKRKLNDIPYDLILCDGPFALVNVPHTRIPIVLNCHNVEYMIIKRYSRLERNPIRGLYASFESHLMHRAERLGCARVSAAMVCSDVDSQLVRAMCPGLRVVVVPNTVEIDLYPQVDEQDRDAERPVLLFTGGMDWYPNRDAVEFFINAILPVVRSHHPQVKFVVAGRNPASSMVEKFKNDIAIEFTGTIPDMRPYLRDATVVVVPLRLGGGTRIKILEAGAAGKPVVSTQIGAEGLDLKPGREILLADDPNAFAQQVSRLLRDSSLRSTIGRSCYAAVSSRYSHLALQQSLDDVFNIFEQPKSDSSIAVEI